MVAVDLSRGLVEQSDQFQDQVDVADDVPLIKSLGHESIS
jgi:hypothetical protein